MGFVVLRSIVRPLCQTFLSRASPASATTSSLSFSSCPKSGFNSFLDGSIYRKSPWVSISNQLHSLTDTRYPKRRPQDKPHRKRASLKPPVWLFVYVYIFDSGENAYVGVLQEEAKKRKAQVQEANRTKKIKQVERKMAAVARERAWAERLVELQRLEEEKYKAMA
ncbi:hypothetical protein CRYUN_Cryun24cG0012200 [Craigia yunnanensis]